MSSYSSKVSKPAPSIEICIPAVKASMRSITLRLHALRGTYVTESEIKTAKAASISRRRDLAGRLGAYGVEDVPIGNQIIARKHLASVSHGLCFY